MATTPSRTPRTGRRTPSAKTPRGDPNGEEIKVLLRVRPISKEERELGMDSLFEVDETGRQCVLHPPPLMLSGQHEEDGRRATVAETPRKRHHGRVPRSKATNASSRRSDIGGKTPSTPSRRPTTPWRTPAYIFVLQNNLEAKTYNFDQVFPEDATQADVFAHVRPLVESAVAGYHATVLAYGSTGSGKTHTIMGDDSAAHADGWGDAGSMGEARPGAGILRRSVNTIFARAAERPDMEFRIEFSYVELYQNKFRDLLWRPMAGSREEAPKIAVRESRTDGVYLEGSTTLRMGVSNADEVLRLLREGNENRAIGATDLNEHSSRSHALAILDVSSRRKKDAGEGVWRRGRLCVVDLAGSERLSLSGSAENAQQLAETQSINLSLTVLADCLSALSSPSREMWLVPYRNSKLTHLLRDSLGGSARTVMLVHARATSPHYRQTLVSLHYAMRAKSVRNRPSTRLDLGPDTDSASSLEAMNRLRELEELRSKVDARTMELAAANAARDHAHSEMAQLRKKLAQAHQDLQTAQTRALQALDACRPPHADAAVMTDHQEQQDENTTTKKQIQVVEKEVQTDEGVYFEGGAAKKSVNFEGGDSTKKSVNFEGGDSTKTSTTPTKASFKSPTKLPTPAKEMICRLEDMLAASKREGDARVSETRRLMAEGLSREREVWWEERRSLERALEEAERLADPALYGQLEQALEEAEEGRDRVRMLEEAVKEAERTFEEERMEAKKAHEEMQRALEEERSRFLVEAEQWQRRVQIEAAETARQKTKVVEAEMAVRAKEADVLWERMQKLLNRAEHLVSSRLQLLAAAQSRHLARFADQTTKAAALHAAEALTTARNADTRIAALARDADDREHTARAVTTAASRRDLEAAVARARAEAHMQGVQEAFAALSSIESIAAKENFLQRKLGKDAAQKLLDDEQEKAQGGRRGNNRFGGGGGALDDGGADPETHAKDTTEKDEKETTKKDAKPTKKSTKKRTKKTSSSSADDSDEGFDPDLAEKLEQELATKAKTKTRRRRKPQPKPTESEETQSSQQPQEDAPKPKTTRQRRRKAPQPKPPSPVVDDPEATEKEEDSFHTQEQPTTTTKTPTSTKTPSRRTRPRKAKAAAAAAISDLATPRRSSAKKPEPEKPLPEDEQDDEATEKEESSFTSKPQQSLPRAGSKRSHTPSSSSSSPSPPKRSKAVPPPPLAPSNAHQKPKKTVAKAPPLNNGFPLFGAGAPKLKKKN